MSKLFVTINTQNIRNVLALYIMQFLEEIFSLVLKWISPIHTNFQETGFKIMKSKFLDGHPCGFNILDLISLGSNITCLHLKYVEIQMAGVMLMDMNFNTFFTLTIIFSAVFTNILLTRHCQRIYTFFFAFRVR
jgi:hypothetical protein